MTSGSEYIEIPICDICHHPHFRGPTCPMPGCLCRPKVRFFPGELEALADSPRIRKGGRMRARGRRPKPPTP